MQINSIGTSFQNSYQNKPNFTSIHIKGGAPSLDRVMQTLDDLDTVDLLKSLQIIKKEAKNPVKAYIEDLGHYFGQQVYGHWEGVVGDKTISNGDPGVLLSYCNEVTFLKKLSKMAQKLNPVKMSKTEEKLLVQQNKLEQMELRDAIYKGKDEESMRDSIMDQIFEFLRIQEK